MLPRANIQFDPDVRPAIGRSGNPAQSQAPYLGRTAGSALSSTAGCCLTRGAGMASAMQEKNKTDGRAVFTARENGDGLATKYTTLPELQGSKDMTYV